MTGYLDENSPKTAEEMLACYERAQNIFRAGNTSNIALNATLFPNWIEDSNIFWYERELKFGKEYRLVDANAYSNKPVFDHFAFAKILSNVSGQEVDARDLPIRNVEISLSPFKLVFTAFGKRWIYLHDTKSCTEIKVHPENWVISPDNLQAIFVRDHNLWLRDIKSGEERALTLDGEEFYEYGALSTIWGKTYPNTKAVQARWSPDGKRVFTLQKDRRRVNTIPVVQYVPLDGSIRPKVEYKKLAYPMDTHVETYRLLVIDIDSDQTHDIDYGPIPTIQNNGTGFFDQEYGWWGQGSRLVYFVDADRYRKYVKLVEFNTDTDTTRILFEETSQTHVSLMPNGNLPAAFVPLPETDELLWYSERSGWAHLYLYDLKTGKLKNAITSGNWRVRDIIRFDGKRRELFISTAGRVDEKNPYYRDLVRVNIDTGEMTTLAASNHEYITIVQKDTTAAYAPRDVALSNGVSPTGDYAVVTRSRVDTVPVSYLLDRNGKKIADLETANLSLPEGWQWPEPVKMQAADGKTDTYGVIYRPSDFSSDKSYPVLDYAMAYNPVSSWISRGSFSNNGYYGNGFYDAVALAELGFIVVQMDGRGTSYRSKAFHDASYGWYASGNNIDDHVSGIKQLAKRYPYMDLSRVGIASLMAGTGAAIGMLQHPEFYAVGAGVQSYDSRLMTAMSVNKFEGLQGPEPGKKYLEELAENLKGKLFLSVALLASSDSPPAATLRIVEALQRANKDFELVVEPKGVTYSNYQIRRAWDFLVRHLQGVEPPKEFRLSNTMWGRNP